MKRRGRSRLLRPALAGLAVLAGLALVGPYEAVGEAVPFDRAKLVSGVDAYLAAREGAYDDIRPDNAMRVVWQGLEDVPTDLAIVYFHGFSASSEEIRPVPDRVADALGANLLFTRFAGHGRGADALGEVRAQDWLTDAAEALEIGRSIGREVIVIATSTGGTLAAISAADPDMMRNVKGIVFISPNFGINNPAAWTLTLPAARYWVPLIAGKTREFEPGNELQALHWTTRYPSTAVFPMAALVKRALEIDHAAIGVPALFYYAAEDQVVDAEATDAVMAAWGGPATRVEPALGPGVDPQAHVVAGDILSPANTDAAVALILSWIEGL